MNITPPVAEDTDIPAPATAFRGRVLLVDDEPVLRALASTILTSQKWEVLSASSAEEAAKLMKYCVWHQTAIDVVILDMVLPGGMSGTEAFAALRSIQPGVPIIATSGFFADEESMMSCRQLGFDDVLPKPYSARTLADMVSRLVPGAVSFVPAVGA